MSFVSSGNPLVTVLMSVYNDCKTVEDAILSILNQTFEHFEFIIVNDGSTDDTISILEKYKSIDSRIKLINKPNSGLTKSLNVGLSQSSGKLVARIDADDTSVKNRLERQIHEFKLKDIVLCGGKGVFNGVSMKTESIVVCNPLILKKLILHRNMFVHSTIMFKRVLNNKEVYYNDKYEYAQDFDLCRWLSNQGSVINIPDILSYNSITNENLSNKYRQKQNHCAYVIACSDTYLRQPIGKLHLGYCDFIYGRKLKVHKLPSIICYGLKIDCIFTIKKLLKRFINQCAIYC